MTIPTVEQFFCHHEQLIIEYEALGVPNARIKVNALAKDLYQYFGFMRLLWSHEDNISRIYLTKQKQQIDIAISPTRFSVKKHHNSHRNLGQCRRMLILYRSTVKSLIDKLERRVQSFPPLGNPLPDVSRKQILERCLTISRKRNFKTRQRRRLF